LIEVLIAISSSNNSAISAGRLGTHAGPVNSGIVVNGVVAAVTADRFVALNLSTDKNSRTAALTISIRHKSFIQP
jgi:hypothetical protein